MQRSLLTGLALATLALPAAADPGQVTVGNARFTVVSPYCIRLEYGQPVDQRSLFAVDRAARFTGFKVTKERVPATLVTRGSITRQRTVIDTGAIRLSYVPDGQPFSADNLGAEIRDGLAWRPGVPSHGNLGGTVRTLDRADGALDLGEGLLSRDGWYLLDDSHTPLLTRDWVESRPKGAGTDWYLFGYGHNYRAALRTLRTIGGAVPLPRKYALGAWYSRYWPYTSTEFRQVVSEYGEHGFPLDNIVLDMDWHKDGWTGWSWNRKLLPDAEKLLAWFHRQGLHDTLNLHPADGVKSHEDAYAKFTADLGASGEIPFDAGSKKYMETLFRDVFQPLEKEGVDFWWLDWQQYPFTVSVPDLTNLFWLNTLIFEHTAEHGQRGLSFSRWGGWGDHRHPIHFSGDASTSFPMLAFEVPFTSTAGDVGCFFWSHDIGGHNRGRNEESYARWVQFGATSAALRSHSTRDKTMDRRPWLYAKWATDSMRISFHLRDTLFPYIYSSAHESVRDMVPLNRAMYIDYPRTEQAYHQAQEYLFGDALLAAPVATPGVGPHRVSHQRVWFPRGSEWFNTFTGEHYAGGREALVSADIDEFPLYAKGGVPIPMQPYTPRMASAPLTHLVVTAYPGREGSFELYEDDGVTRAYERGAFATTRLGYRRNGNTVTLTIGAAHGRYRGQVRTRALTVRLPDTAPAQSVAVNGQAVRSRYDAASMTNLIDLPSGPIDRALTVTVQTGPVDLAKLAQRARDRRVAGVLGHPADLVKAAGEATDMAVRDELLAVAGIGLVKHNQSPTLFGGPVVDKYFPPSGGNGVFIQGRELMHRGHPVHRQSQVSFDFHGVPMALPAEVPLDALLGPDNLAETARVTASASEPGSSPEGAVDGIVGGYPIDPSHEWSSGQKTGWLQLDWDAPQNVGSIELYDRPGLMSQVTSGTLTFSDGTSLPVGPLPDDGSSPLTLRFPKKSITWVRFSFDKLKVDSTGGGLGEIGVYRAP